MHGAEALANDALAAAEAAGARYVEVRVVRRTREALNFKDGALDRSRVDNDYGIGIRALVDNGWGYAATNILSGDSVSRAARQAAKVAGATAATARHEVHVPKQVTGSYSTALSEDPLAVSIAEKTAIFEAAHQRMLAFEGVKTARGSMLAQRNHSLFVASNGSQIKQTVVLSGAGMEAIAVNGTEVQTRSAPKSFEGDVLQGGFEVIREHDLVGRSRQVAEEAVALSRAEALPAGETTVVLGGAQLSLQIHESVGHPTELDRVLGEEISLAGASFLLPEALDTLQFGSAIVNLTADATTPRGPGTFGFDDEGTPATRTPLVRDGRFVGYLSGRDTAQRLGRASASCLRAESWSRLPIVRMININLEPGAGTLDDLIGGVDEGVLLDCNKSWSIDDLRLNFQFSTEIAYEIKAGKLTGRIFRNPVYYGVTPKFWNKCSAIAGEEAWRMWGWMFCGKGDPCQLMYVGHGCAPARFDGVRVGST